MYSTIIFGGSFFVGQSWDILTLDAYGFTEAAVPFFRKYVPVNLKFAYTYNGLPDYETHIHTMLPLIQAGWRYFGFSIGETLRFTHFSDGPALFEPILTLTNRFRLTPLISIAGEMKIDISGNVGHLTSVYGLSFREGMIFTW